MTGTGAVQRQNRKDSKCPELFLPSFFIPALIGVLQCFTPRFDGVTFAPRSFILLTFGDCRATSTLPIKISHSSPRRAAHVAVATPCCPAPVSAIILLFPMYLASRACPRALFSLCEPVWTRSSRLKYILTP